MYSDKQYVLLVCLALGVAATNAIPAAKEEEKVRQVEGEPIENVGEQEEVSSTTVKATTGNKYELEPLVVPGGCSNDTDVIDERQKGEENYKISLNGIRIIVAPANSAMGALFAEMKKSDKNENKNTTPELQAEKQKRRLHLTLPWLLKNINFNKPEKE